MIAVRFILLVVVLISVASGNTPFNKVLLTQAVANGAVCIDGTPSAYYLRTGTEVNKWYIFHEGGGYCPALSDCYARSQTDLGSSKNYANQADIQNDYFSQNANNNPLLYNWNVVYIKYCDGGFYTGNNATAADFNGHKLYFRGVSILAAINEDLMANKGLAQATDVVVGGCSAGGVGTYTRLDWWREHLPQKAKVVGLPDSGYVLDYDSKSGAHFHSDVVWLWNNMNLTAGANTKCVEAFKPTGDTWKCGFAQWTAPFISTPIFPLQSEYDSWQIPNDLDSTDPTLINQWGANLVQLVKTTLLNRPQNGVFLDSCYHHCGGWTSIKVNGINQANGFKRWYEGDNTQYFQDKVYPCNTCC